LLLAAVGVAACSPSTGQEPETPADEELADGKLPHQTVERITIVGYRTSDLLAELERARAHLLVDRFEKAAKAFDRLMRISANPKITAVAMFNAGVAYEGLGKRDIAVRRYRELVDGYGAEQIARPGHLRLTRQLGYLERWQDLVEAADSLLERKDLSILDRIEGLGARALGLVEQKKVEEARISIGKAQELIDKHKLGLTGVPPFQLAQVAFAEGEARRLLSEKIKLVPVPPQFGEVLEARCQGLLDAQSAYTEAMRSRDGHWSAMSGYRIGQLYQQLHVEAMQIPPPQHADEKKAKLFEAAMRLRYRILLEKGLEMMRGTVRLGQRTGEDSYWIARAKEAVTALEKSLAEEKAALENVPYTEQEVRAALDKLAKKVKDEKATP
jgi:tetratricopeptide (TPR) repeat protein